MNSIITLQEYLRKGKTFVIPDYQRGYIWGKKRADGSNSAENLLKDLLSHFRNGMGVFLHGVTVSETGKEIVLVDGQQRTTFLLFLMKRLGYAQKFEIHYCVRTNSNEFLAEQEWDVTDNPKEEYQDIYFFKKTLRIIDETIKDIDKEAFLDFMLAKVKFMYINIKGIKPEIVFNMMNGSKADMRQEEIIKAEILRLASLSGETIEMTREWENQMLRSRYAREWDKWLHWWNKKEVQQVFDCSNPMGQLVSSYSKLKNGEELNFEQFKKAFLNVGLSIEAKRTFDGLRRLQKRFEDAFNTPVIRNRIGAILKVVGKDQANKFIQYYFVEEHQDPEDLQRYYKAVFIKMTHDEIVNKDLEKDKEKYEAALESISNDFLFSSDKEFAFSLLLRLNVDQDIAQDRLFNFEIWNNRSLEHIYAKSKVKHLGEDGKWLDWEDKPTSAPVDGDLRREDIVFMKDGMEFTGTEHCIGNLVLLYKNENSAFNDADFAEKKRMFFNPTKEGLVKSRHLLHTVCVFAEKEVWDGPAIAENKLKMIEQFKKDYSDFAKLENEKQD